MADGSTRAADSSDMSLSSPHNSPPSVAVPLSPKDDSAADNGRNGQQPAEEEISAINEEIRRVPPPPFSPPPPEQLVRPPPSEVLVSTLRVPPVAPAGTAHAPDPLLDLSTSLTVRAADEGQLYGFLAVYAALGRQGCAAAVRGEFDPPPAAFRCHAPLCSLAARYRSARAGASSPSSPKTAAAGTASAAETVIREIEPLPRCEHGTAEDAAARRLYAYVLAFVLQETVLAHELAAPAEVVSAFSSTDLRVPALSLLRFVERLLRYLPATKELFVVGLIYLDRALAADPELRITATNVHRLYFAAMVVASKFFDDYFFANAAAARIAGLTVKDLRDLEVDFLAGVSFTLCVDDALFRAYLEPFEQLTGLLRILPLDTDPDTLPAFRAYPACGKWTWTPLDELFYYIQCERQRLASTLDTSNPALLSPDAHPSHSIGPPLPQQPRISSLLSPSSATTITMDVRKSVANLPHSSDIAPRDDKPSEPSPLPQSCVDTTVSSSHHHHHHHHHHRHHHHHDDCKHKTKKHEHKGSTKTSDVSMDATVSSKQKKKDKSTTSTVSTTSTSTAEQEKKKRKHHGDRHHHHHHKRKGGDDLASVQKSVLPSEHPHHSSAIMHDEQQSGCRSA